jgi:hypothetical protein
MGAHPGHFCRDEAEEELKGSLFIAPEVIPFQLSTRTISIPLKGVTLVALVFKRW